MSPSSAGLGPGHKGENDGVSFRPWEKKRKLSHPYEAVHLHPFEKSDVCTELRHSGCDGLLGDASNDLDHQTDVERNNAVGTNPTCRRQRSADEISHAMGRPCSVCGRDVTGNAMKSP